MIPCGKSELFLFDESPVQNSLTSASWVDFHALSNTQQGGPIEFFVGSTHDEYLDLNDTKLYLQVKLDEVATDAEVGPVNLLLSSLFQDVTLTLNDQVVQGGDQLYAYKAMLNSMLLFDKGVKQTQLGAAGWEPDQVGKYNDATNSGLIKRIDKFKDEKVCELMGPLHLDLMTQPKYLLPRVDMRLRLTRNSNSFTQMCFNKTGDVAKIKIIKAILYVRKVKVLPSVVEGHEGGLENYNAKYPIQRTLAQTFTVGTGVQSFNKENLFQGRMPKLVVIAMVSNKAFAGALTSNPFYFNNYNCNYCGLFRDGESIPDREPYSMIDTDSYVRPYLGMIHALEFFNRNDTNGITYEEFKSGSTLFVFNLTPDLTVGSGCQQAFRSGNLRLEMRFSEALSETINVLCYGVFDGQIEVTRQRNILLDY